MNGWHLLTVTSRFAGTNPLQTGTRAESENARDPVPESGDAIEEAPARRLLRLQKISITGASKRDGEITLTGESRLSTGERFKLQIMLLRRPSPAYEHFAFNPPQG